MEMQIYSYEKMLEVAKRGMGKDDVVFADEIAVVPAAPPNGVLPATPGRVKPRYFNRVVMGFDWNRYNRAHYDKDTPPPKYIQGYRFNIFYPDLEDMTRTPHFKLFEVRGDEEHAILRFYAGPPYQDIALKIKDEKWDVDYKHGYRSQFSNGLLQLWFNFERVRYRR